MEEAIKIFQQYLEEKESGKAIELLEKNRELLTAKTENGLSLLLLAAYYKNAEVLNFFVENKTPLDFYESIAIGNLEQVKKQLEAHPEWINHYSDDGFTPLGLASYFGHHELVAFFIEKGADVNQFSSNGTKIAPLHAAVASKHFGIVRLLLEKGANVNARQALGVTALHSAAHQGNYEMVKLLLDHHADMEAQMENGKKPIDFAKEEKNMRVLELLSN